jgi:RNA polymerase sigma-70 factor (ECF subfamily)
MTNPLTGEKLSDQLSDEELAGLFRASGKREIIGELYKRYAHLVLGVCINYLKNRDDARDAAMEVFERLFVSLRKYEVHNFKSWLFTVTKSQCAMILRQRKKEGVSVGWEDNLLGEVMENGSFLHPSSEDELEDRIRKLHHALNHLSPGQQQCVLLFYFDEKSYQEIEKQTGYSAKEVKSYLQNGKRNLKLALENHLYPEI